jgi:O-antigen/teichoic acid export membrane protein
VSAARASVTAARAALTVGASVLAGAGFAAVVRVALPRALGPAGYGTYRVAESAAEALLLVLTLGLDTALRRDVAQAPDLAATRLAEVLRLRAVGGALALLVAIAAFWWAGASPTLLALFSAFAAAQVCAALANAHASTLHAVGDAAWPSAASVASRALWAVLALAVLRVAPLPLLVALAVIAAEAGRWWALQRRSRRRHGARPRDVTLRAALAAAVASLPLFVNYLAHSLYARLGTWTLGLRASTAEVGWFATGSNVAGLALLGMPLITWVLLPATARATHDADETVRDALVVGALRATLLLGVPGVALLMLLAEPLVIALFGPAFAPAAATLQVLAPTIGLAYLATIAAVALIQRGAERRVALVSVLGLGVSLALNVALLRGGAPGAFARQAATAALATEALVTLTMLALAWRRSWRRPLLQTVAGTGAALAAAVAMHRLTSVAGSWYPLALGCAAVTLVAVLFLTRALRRDDVAFALAVLRKDRSRVPA